MVLILHIIIAISSIVYTTFVYCFPSAKKLFFSYGLVALTLLSGTLLVFLKPTHIMHTCIMGLIYIAIVSYAIVAVRNKLAKIAAEE